MASRERPAAQPLRGFGPGPNPLVHGPRAEHADLAARRLWGYLRAYRGALAGVVAMVVVSTALTVANPYLLKVAIDRAIVPGRMDLLARVVGLMLGLYLLNSLAYWLQTVGMIRVSQRAVRDLRRDLFGSLQRVALRYFDTHAHGDLMSRLTNDVETLNAVLSQAVVQLVGSALMLVGATLAMLSLDVRMTVAAVTVVPLMVLITHLLGRATRDRFRARQAELGVLNGLIEETLTGQRVVKAYGREGKVLEAFDAANLSYKQAALRAGIVGGLMGPSMNLLRNLSFAVLVAVGGWLVIRGWTTLGTVAAFLGYSQQFMWPLSQIANIYGMVQGALAGAERVFTTMDEPPELPDAPDAVALPEVRGEVVFDHVTFGYDPAEPVLHDVSFTACPGQTLALVGPTGAGKTTITNLLTRFYDVDDGSIRVDGHDLRAVRRHDLRRALGMVPQDTFLFADTVRENLRYGRLEATDEEVEEAARLANADAFIRHLPHGYETELSEAGGSLSAGQRQLLAIARAILADPAVLILDEATSSVDTRTEAHIQEAMLRLMEGRTSFLIAHRLSTVRHADCILVIDGGRVAESGTHAELMAARGLYWRLHTTHYEGGVDAAAG